MADAAILERAGPVLKIINNNPKRRNALRVEFLEALVGALKEAAEDRTVAAVVLAGAGGFFSAGGDLNVLIKRREMDVAGRIAAIGILHGAIMAIWDSPKPVIAAIEGGAAGAGVPLALACDLVVAAHDAYFALSYSRVGLTPDGGSTAFLSEIAPRQLVNEMVMFGDKFPVDRLHALGAVNRLAEPGKAEAMACELAVRLGNRGPEALAAAKRLVWSASDNDLKTQLDFEARAMAQAQGGDEAGEGISAFLEKRRADFGKFRG